MENVQASCRTPEQHCSTFIKYWVLHYFRNVNTSFVTHIYPFRSRIEAPTQNNFNLNPNIGSDGRNLPLAGNIATIVIITSGLGLMIPSILNEGFGLNLDADWEIFAYLAPCVNDSLLIPFLFFARKPKTIRIILDVIEDMFGVNLNIDLMNPFRRSVRV